MKNLKKNLRYSLYLLLAVGVFATGYCIGKNKTYSNIEKSGMYGIDSISGTYYALDEPYYRKDSLFTGSHWVYMTIFYDGKILEYDYYKNIVCGDTYR